MTFRRRLIPLLVCPLILLGCGRDPAPVQAAIDSLALPPAWQVEKTVLKGGSSACIQIMDLYCPSVSRYYVATGELPDLFHDVKTSALEAGFSELFEGPPNCDLHTNFVTSKCYLTVAKAGVTLEVILYLPGEYVDAPELSVPNHPTVRITARTATEGEQGSPVP